MAFATKESKAILAARAARAVDRMADFDSKTLLEKCEQIWEASKSTQKDEVDVRRESPVFRVFTSAMTLKHVASNVLSYDLEWIENDTGTGSTVHFAEEQEAQWLVDIYTRVAAGEGEAPILVADYVGARWSGILDNVAIEETSDGDQIVTATWINDYEQLKWLLCWPTPFFPAAIQFKAWILVGPTDWCASTTLHINLWRKQSSSIPLTNDPIASMTGVSNWPIVVTPKSFALSAAGGSLWSMPIIRMKTWHDAFETSLADAEMHVEVTRWIAGDDPPWPGASLRSGTLVVNIVDKSGRYNTGTAEGGNLFSGLSETIASITTDFIDTLFTSVNNTIPGEYMVIGQKSTNKTMPYVIFRPGYTPGCISAMFRVTPAKGTQIITGGKSMPGVNEAISATIQAIGDIIGDNLTVFGYGVGSIGGAIDTLLKPLYEDTILAWTQTLSAGRVARHGWSALYEWFQDGADQAYTLNSLVVIRTGLWTTRRQMTHEMKIMDACPWIIGDRGVGHIWLGDRVGTTQPRDDSGRVWVDRIKKISLSADESTWRPEWDVSIGSDEEEDPFMKSMRRIREIASGMHDLGLA